MNLEKNKKNSGRRDTSFSLRRISQSVLRSVERAVPEKIKGESGILREKLSARYSGQQLSEAVEKYQRRNLRIYIFVISGVLLLAGTAILSSVLSEEEIAAIRRPKEGEGQKTIPVTVEAQTGESRIKESVGIVVQEEKRTEEEKEKLLSAYAVRLPDLVAPETGGRRIVTESFTLPSEDETGEISVLWESSDPVLISEDGQYDVLALAEEEEEVALQAHLTLEDMEKTVSFSVILRKDPSLYRASVAGKIREIAEELSSGSEGNIINLPQKIGEEITLSWKTYDSQSAGMIIAAGVIAVIAAFSRRYSFAEREIRKYRREIIRRFPAFIDKLVLLLNSGLTVISAMDKIASDYEKQAAEDSNHFLAAEVAAIGRRVREMNAPITQEWKDLSARTGINELMRFSTIIEDNLHKGTMMAEKLEVEGNLLREREKKSVQEKMRMIDTRLTLPMILMLFSLVLVTVAPALMQM